MKNLERLRDIMSGLGISEPRHQKEFIDAYFEIRIQGFAFFQSCQTFVNFGFNIISEISGIEKCPYVLLKDEIKEKGISFDRVESAIIHCTNDGGKFYDLYNLNKKKDQ